MEIRPILSAMLRNKTGPLLIAIQIAITLAIVTNSAFIIQQRAEKMDRPTGMDDRNLIFARSYGFGESYDHRETIRKDIEQVGAMPGVKAVAYMSNTPLSGSGSNSGFYANPPVPDESSDGNGNYYSIDENGLEALGLRLADGRWFRAEEIEYRPGENYLPEASIVTREFADEVYGEGVPVVGKLLYDTVGKSTRIIGVVEHMQGAWVGWEGLNRVLLHGMISDGPIAHYAIRVEPGMKDQLVPDIEAKMQEINRNRVILSVQPLSEHMERSYSRDSAMIQMLTGVSVLLVAVTALGIVGLAAFNVNQRRKQIGTRRALGATRSDVLRYFMTESLMIATGGVALGTLLAFLMSWWLGTEFSLKPLDWRYVPPAIVGLLIISQLAVFGPARRASSVSPALATRSV